MAYTDGEGAILTRIRAHSDFSTSNTDANDWKILDSGNSAFYAILKPNEEPNDVEYYAFGSYVIRWQTVVEIWQRYKDDGTTAASLFGNVQKIIAQMQPYKTLGLANVQNAEVVSVTAPSFRWDQDGGPAWMVQEVNIEWHEQSEITFV